MDYRGGIDQEAIVGRLQRGDIQALEELFDSYAGYALILARHIAGDEAAAEQAVHEAFVDLWRNPSSDAAGDLYSRLLRSVHHRAMPPAKHVRDWQTAGMTVQKWTSPTSAASPPPWVVKQAPPGWLTERAQTEKWPDDSIETWRAALVELEVAEVHLTSDVRGVTIDLDGTAPQTLNDDDATPLGSAIGRGVDRLRVKKKSDEGLTARRSAPPAPAD